jgi:hypothetical protein
VDVTPMRATVVSGRLGGPCRAYRAGDCLAHVETVVAWSVDLGIDPAHVEYLMFADAVTTEPTSQCAGTIVG